MSLTGRAVARRPHPSTVADRDRVAAVLSWTCSTLWGFRLETLALALAAAGYLALTGPGRLTMVGAGVEELALLALLLVIGPVRRGLVRALSAARVRRRWRRAWLHCGLPPVPARGVSRVPAGVRVHVRVSRGSSFVDVEDRCEELAACLRLREVRVERDPGDASRGTVTLVARDPLAELGGLPWPLAGASALSLWDAFALGVGEDGAHIALRLPWRNLLAGGEPGAGKSAAVAIMLAVAALDRTVRLWLLDGKLVELAAWAPVAQRTVGPDIGQAIELLEAVQRVMEERYRDLLASGRRKIEPSPELPLHVVACDELALYLLAEDRKQRTRFAELLRDLVARGRAAGVIVLAATQKPSADVVPSALRDLFGFRLAFRCTTPQASDTILGQGWASQGYNAATISPADRGVGFLLAEDGLPVRLRTFYLDDDAIRDLATRAAGLRLQPGRLLELAS